MHAAWWLIAYLPAMAAISLVGSKQFGGLGWLPYGWDMLLVALLALGFYYWGVSAGYRSPYLDECHEDDDAVASPKALASAPG